MRMVEGMVGPVVAMLILIPWHIMLMTLMIIFLMVRMIVI